MVEAIAASAPLLLVLTGFMGTGKTSVGHVVAEKLGREFLDMDVQIEAEEGMPIRDIFATRGEPYFRTREADLCARLASSGNRVVATGGGALLSPANRAQFADALVVCLDAAPDEILGRLNGNQDRPLLQTANPRQRIVELMDSRRPAYAQIEWHLDTTGKSIDQVADEIVAILQPRKLSVSSPDSLCPIFVGAGLLGRTGKLVNLSTDAFSPACAIITSPAVRALHAAGLVDSLSRRGFLPHVVEIADDEESKTLESVGRVYDALIDGQLDRHSIIFALGGGAIGDIAGFAAATFMRGVSFVQMPTTLSAMVDDSIGGKVAVDHPRGKNLIGAFKHPYAVIADTDTLATLSPREFRSGMAEVVKHGIIGDVGLFEMLEREPHVNPLSTQEKHNWLARAMQVKINIVARDPFEQGERGKLNLGHTFGHAIEKLSGPRFLHGEAVAVGLVCAARLAVRRELCEAPLAARIENLVRAIGLPTRVPAGLTAPVILSAMQTDKKRLAGHLRFVLPRALGDVVLADDVPAADVAAVLDATRE